MSDDEIAAVLAHEIAHVLANHAREIRSTSALADVILAPFFTVFNVAWNIGLARRSSTANPRYIANLLCLYRRRRQEEEADYMGTFLMMNAGFDPSAMLSVYNKFENLQDQALSADPTIQRVPEWKNTHPNVGLNPIWVDMRPRAN